MIQKYKGKIVVVTASSTGIGYACSELLALQGATVIINSRNQKNVDDAVNKIKSKGGDAHGLVVHASKPSDREKLIKFVKEKFGGIDILIPNAAVSTHLGSFIDTPADAMDKMYDVNYKSIHMLVKECRPLMENRKGANIILMSSVGAFEADKIIGFYAITKTMLVIAAKLMAQELTGVGIRVNCVNPGLIKTKFSSGLWDGKEEMVMEKYGSIGLTRLGEPIDIANVVSFLGSSDADYINGECIVVAGRPLARI